VGVHGGLDDGALDLAGLGVGHVHVHREEAALERNTSWRPSGLSLGAMFSLRRRVLRDQRAPVIRGPCFEAISGW
jgi:hypothetical protein